MRTTKSLARTSSTGGGRVRGMCRNQSPIASGPWQWKRVQPLRCSKLGCERGWGLLLPLEDNRWRADLGDRLIRNRPAPRPCLGRLTRPPRQLLLLQQTHRRAPCRRKELSQAACCFGTGQTPAVGGYIKRTCQRN